MKQTVTIEIEDAVVLQLLRNLASMSLVRFTSEVASEEEHITNRLNEIFKEADSSLDPCLILAQSEAIGTEDW